MPKLLNIQNIEKEIEIKLSVIGLGFVGSSMLKSLKLKNYNIIGYDKYKNSDSFEDCLKTDVIFLALPTLFDENTKEYDKSCIEETCYKLVANNYKGIVVIKSTIEPKTTYKLSKKYSLKFVHNPEFLSAATAFEDFDNQTHIVLGSGPGVSKQDLEYLKTIYEFGFPNAEFSLCTSDESESMKIFCNCFYSVKIQFFNELYLLCQKMDCDYECVKNMMLKNNWINPMHTKVPGPDGQLSYGGFCFTKDTCALLEFMKINSTPYEVLQASINERNKIKNNKPAAKTPNLIEPLLGLKYCCVNIKFHFFWELNRTTFGIEIPMW
jgi:UDPglucose 6-dehydrogenase